MNRRTGGVIAVVLVLAGGLVLFTLVQQRALMAQVQVERALAEEERQRGEEALGRRNLANAEPRQPRWEYRVLTIEGNDNAVNQAIGKLTDDSWEYVGVVPAPQGVFFARMVFKRLKR
jgi:hypothetical protein